MKSEDPFEPYPGLPTHDGEFAQPDTTVSDFKKWLRSNECRRELEALTGSKSEERLPEGVYIQQQNDGRWTLFADVGRGWFDVYEGRSREELLRLVRNSCRSEKTSNK